MTKTVLVPVANGSEELETISIVDTLRRAGAKVTIASVETSKEVKMSRDVKIVADDLIDHCVGKDWDLVVLPGGMPGAEHLHKSSNLQKILKKQKESDRWYGAICASPAVVLQPLGLLDGHKATAYPSFADKLENSSNEKVVVSGKCVTSQGPGTAVVFALRLVELLYDQQTATKVANGMLVDHW